MRGQIAALGFALRRGFWGRSGGNQFCAVCVGRLGCLFDKPYTCNLADGRLFDKPQTYDLTDRRLFDKHQNFDLIDRRLFDKPRTRALIDRRLFNRNQTCDLIDWCLFDKPQTHALINRRLFASGEFARSISRGLFDSGHQRASWAASRMVRHRLPLWGRGYLWSRERDAFSSFFIIMDLMKHASILLLFMLVTSMAVRAQHAFVGKVMDGQGRPLELATAMWTLRCAPAV